MKRILVTAIGGDVGYGVVKSLKRSGREIYIIGCDIQKYNYARDVVDKFVVAPSYSDESTWIEFMINLIQDNNIDYFWPVTEPEIKIVDGNRDVFKNVTVFINASNILEIALDKGKTAKFLKQAKVDTPRTWDSIEGFADASDIEYPFIIKEKFSCGSNGVCIVKDLAELEKKYAEMENVIIQEYVGSPDEEYTMTIFSDGIIVNHIAFKRILGLGGMSRFVELVQDDSLRVIAGKIAEAFDLKGSINVQMRKRNNCFCVFEINPRISSTIGFRNQLGFNDVAWWIDMQEGKQVNKYDTPKAKVHGVRSVEEKLFFE